MKMAEMAAKMMAELMAELILKEPRRRSAD